MKVKHLILSPTHYENYLKKELGTISYENKKNVFLINDDVSLKDILWQNTSWLDPNTIYFDSIKEGANQLKRIAKYCYLLPYSHYRRAILIQSLLRPKEIKRIEFGEDLPPKNYLEWTLIDKNTILYATKTLHPYPLGQCEFIENKSEPPSRAYLKLWEVFQVYLPLPEASSNAVDLGSSPGGWTWFLLKHFHKVRSVDTAPLNLKENPSNLEYIKKDAFHLKTKDFQDIDYFFSDMACEPEKLYEMIKKLIKETNIHTFVCTIKLSDRLEEKDVIQKFSEISNSKLVHLYQNKHEFTWIYSSRFSIA